MTVITYLCLEGSLLLRPLATLAKATGMPNPSDVQNFTAVAEQGAAI